LNATRCPSRSVSASVPSTSQSSASSMERDRLAYE
jgi:hypothetical protein